MLDIRPVIVYKTLSYTYMYIKKLAWGSGERSKGVGGGGGGGGGFLKLGD